jgi:5-methylcytosine-specific restriction endonuclease McrA
VKLTTLKPRIGTVPDGNRIRGRKLQQIRERHFKKNPLCVLCKAAGRVVPATELDHRIALVNGGTDTDDNRQGLCADCHKRKTAEDLGYKPKARIGLDGFPVEE